jgi:hypothetical protein
MILHLVLAIYYVVGYYMNLDSTNLFYVWRPPGKDNMYSEQCIVRSLGDYFSYNGQEFFL